MATLIDDLRDVAMLAAMQAEKVGACDAVGRVVALVAAYDALAPDAQTDPMVVGKLVLGVYNGDTTSNE